MSAAEIELAAVLGFAFLAAKFAVEPETWPVFLAYVEDGPAKPIGWTREKLGVLVDVLQQLMELDAVLLAGDEP